MSERQAAMESTQWIEDCAEGMEEEGLDRENNARHFRTGAKYIRAALQTPPVQERKRVDLDNFLMPMPIGASGRERGHIEGNNIAINRMKQFDVFERG